MECSIVSNLEEYYPFEENQDMCSIKEPSPPRERSILDEVEGVLKEKIGYVCGWKELENEGKALCKALNPTKQLAVARKRLYTIMVQDENSVGNYQNNHCGGDNTDQIRNECQQLQDTC